MDGLVWTGWAVAVTKAVARERIYIGRVKRLLAYTRRNIARHPLRSTKMYIVQFIASLHVFKKKHHTIKLPPNASDLVHTCVHINLHSLGHSSLSVNERKHAREVNTRENIIDIIQTLINVYNDDAIIP